ncbi:hypothetical protein ACQPZG_03255 (plasmid) [Streptomyces sp. CA-294286]|uniref:hypothetical protein n=1 Tax=Streptomyces sp. CA-294286 TaxID=3240070 RepID=UPI003D946D59
MAAVRRGGPPVDLLTDGEPRHPVAEALDRAAELVAQDERRGAEEIHIDVTLYALEEYGCRYAKLLQWTHDQRPTVADVIGRPPHTFDDWVSENIDFYR